MRGLGVDPVTGEVVSIEKVTANLRVIYNCNRCGKRISSYAVTKGQTTTAPDSCPRCDIGLSSVTTDELLEELQRRVEDK